MIKLEKEPPFKTIESLDISEAIDTLKQGGKKIISKAQEAIDTIAKIARKRTEERNREIRLRALRLAMEHATKQQVATPKPTVSKTITVTPNVSVTKVVKAVAPSPLSHVKDIIRICDGTDKGSDSYLKARIYARFAAHTYGDLLDDVLPDEYHVIQRYSTEEHLRATVYTAYNEIICAFCGTEMTNLKDWECNFSQLEGESIQYEEALNFARKLKDENPYKRLIFVGHSKGGGQAAYCAYTLNKEAVTFNPAGLSMLTLGKHTSLGRNTCKIDAYIYSTDVLNALQSAVGIQPNGEVHHVDSNLFLHGCHGILGILRYYDIKYTECESKW